MSNLLGIGFAFSLLFAIVYFGFVKPFKENTEKSGETLKSLLEQGARRVEVEQHYNKDFLGCSGGWLISFGMLFTFWWLYMEFSLIPLAIVWTIMIFFRVGKF